MADPIIARDLTPGQQSLLYASLITVLAQDIARARGLLRLDQYLVTLPLEEQRAMRQAARFAIRPESIVHTAQMYLRRNLAPRLYGGATFDKLTLVERHSSPRQPSWSGKRSWMCSRCGRLTLRRGRPTA